MSIRVVRLQQAPQQPTNPSINRASPRTIRTIAIAVSIAPRSRLSVFKFVSPVEK